jgi:hypothetical protein
MRRISSSASTRITCGRWINLYRIAYNTPIQFVDLFGLTPEGAITGGIIGGGIGGGVGWVIGGGTGVVGGILVGTPVAPGVGTVAGGAAGGISGGAVGAAIGGSAGALAGAWIGDVVSDRWNSDYRPRYKPKNCPPGTIPINKHPGTRDDVHGIKGQLKNEGVGPKSWVGVSPAGDIIVTNPDGTAGNLGPAESYQ